MSQLTDLKQPIAIRSEYVALDPTTIHVKQHRHPDNKPFSHSAGLTVWRWPESSSSQSQDERKLFSATDESSAGELRRHYFDASGLPLFELSKKLGSGTFFVHAPGRGRKGTPKSELQSEAMAVIAPRWNPLRYSFDVYARNVAWNGEEVLLKVRGQDMLKSRTNVYFDKMLVMTATRIDGFMSFTELEWKVEVAGGLDSSLASAIMSVLGFMLYGAGMSSYRGARDSPVGGK
ncbi:hypothetical protein BDW72DRAFT_213095 [Aspergillus terricola var. indicus]